MRNILLFGALLAAMPATAATQPDFQPLAGRKSNASIKNGPVMRSPLAQTIDAPLVSETQAIPTRDGGIEIKCREIPNPRLPEAGKSTLPGPQQ
ncbi:MAG: hypothetical protein JNN30_12080 [Rhodanobacteraceae bacterium]|nr:hypothetical protein [Rhodanobacteraceae bacterium]